MAIFNKYLGFRGRNLDVAITVAAGLIFVAFGYGQADVGGLVTVPSFQRQFSMINLIELKDHTAAVKQGIVVASWNLGCFASALLSIFIGDVLGRKRMLMMGIIILVIGKIIQCSSYGLGQYITGRVIAGFGNGFNASTAPAWQAECTKAHRRGRFLIVSSGACIALGAAIAYWVDFILAYADPNSAAWRFPMAAQILWVLLPFFMLFHMPESPRWLILRGREREALDVLAALNDLSPEHEDVRDEFLQCKDAILQMVSGSPKQAFSMGEYRYLHRILLAVLLQVMQQWTGINLFIQYLAEMFVVEAGTHGWRARLLAAGAATESCAVAFVSVLVVDRFWGRRTLTITGSTGMTACMIALAIGAYYDTDASRKLMAVVMFIYMSFFSFGWQGMSWLWAVELVPLPVRGPANALATSANWVSNFIVVFISPIALIGIGWKTYLIFLCTNLVTIPLIYFLYPETGCRSLEEVDQLFYLAGQSNKPWLAIKGVADEQPLWYGKNGQQPFAYEKSEWHMRFARLSSESESRSEPGSAPHGPQDEDAEREKAAGYV